MIAEAAQTSPASRSASRSLTHGPLIPLQAPFDLLKLHASIDASIIG